MHELELNGSYYDIGLKTGKLLKKEIDNGFPTKFSEENIEKGKEYERKVREYAPELLEELQGIADGSGIDYDVLVTFELSPLRDQPSCLVMAIPGEYTRSGLPIFARNHEWVEEDSEALTLCYTKPKGKIPSLGFTFYWRLLSRYGGINKAGLAISSAAASFVNAGPGVMFNMTTRWILDNCRTTEEAVAFLEKIPKVWGTVYLIMDKNTIAKVEAHREKTKVTYIEGCGFVTLRFDSPEMVQYNQEDDSLLELYSGRKDFLTKWFLHNKGNIDNDMIIGVLKDHEHEMCCHIPGDTVSYGICWSWIVTPGGDEALVCAGPPCKNEFKKYVIDKKDV
jgi:predicted choloylglycine hydrolase